MFAAVPKRKIDAESADAPTRVAIVGGGVADRIEEHGLHLWMGFYENAFRLMRA